MIPAAEAATLDLRSIRLRPFGTGFVIDAADLGPLLDLPADEAPRLMREGRITRLTEEGRGEDKGRHRITFRFGLTRVRLTVDGEGRVLQTSRIRRAEPAATGFHSPAVPSGGSGTRAREAKT